MNNQHTTPKKNTSYSHSIIFEVKGKLALIHSLIQKGVHIEIEPTCQYACAGFDKITDYNNFKDMISKLRVTA